MKPWSEFDDITAHECSRFRAEPDRKVRLVALLFCRPELALMKTDIIPSIPYFHRRSGFHTAFYFAGFDDRTRFASPWKKKLDAGEILVETETDGGSIVAKVHRVDRPEPMLSISGPDGRFWIFDPWQFNRLRMDVEEQTRWRYSGGCDMILLNSRRDRGIEFGTAVVLHLDQISELTTTPTVSQLFESIFQYADGQKEENPTWGLSDFLGFKIAKKGLWEFIVGLLPEGVRNSAKAARNVAVQNIALRATT